MGVFQLCALFAIAFSQPFVTSQVVNTTSGTVRGIRLEEKNVTRYLGIPYAEAPEGELRFEPPVRKARMEGVFNATSNAFLCPQDLLFVVNGSTVTEDCLRLDIYVPSYPGMTSLPVMVWVHGGGFVLGNSLQYDGTPLARQGVIVVVINYRLGVLGFLDTKDSNAVGNFGLRDQCSAIEWVVDNIENFGGNSSDITIFGESAGSVSVLQLAISSLCEGKFHRVIAQSGSPLAPWAFTNDPMKAAKSLATRLQCPSESSALVNCLRQKTWKEILDNQKSFAFEGFDCGPSYSGDVFPENPIDVLKGQSPSSAILKRFKSLDLMIGVVSEEGELELTFDVFGPPALLGVQLMNTSRAKFDGQEYDKRLRKIMESYLNDKEFNKMYPALKYQYTDWNKLDNGNTRMIMRLLGDLSFHVNVVQTARAHARLSSSNNNDKNGSVRQGRTYFYRFLRRGSWQQTYPWTQGATHGDDVNFMFYNAFIQNNGTLEEKHLAQSMVEYWTNFAKTGSPNSPSDMYSNTTWPLFVTDKEEYIELDINMSANSTGTHPYGRRVAFWENFFTPQLKMIREDKKQSKPKECDTGKTGNSAEIQFLCEVLWVVCLLNSVFLTKF